MGGKIFVHIGGEKTGTTSLQEFLTRNASKLSPQGFYYPSEPDNIIFSHTAHFPVAASLIDQKVGFIDRQRRTTLSLVPASLKRTIAGTNCTTILSCEHFSSRLKNVEQLRALRNLLPADEIKIVYYIREPSDLALASWSTFVLCGGRQEFDPSIVVPANRYFNHLETLRLWGTVFGDENLIVREYKRLALRCGDIRRDFCDVLGIQTAAMQFDQDANQSIDLQRLEVLRYLNFALSEFHECEDKWLVAENLRAVVSSHIPEGGDLNMLISEKERTAIKARFYDVNRQINEKYLSGRLSNDWFPDPEMSRKNSVATTPTQDISPILRETIIRLATTMDASNRKLRETQQLRKAPRCKERRLSRFFKRLRRASGRLLELSSVRN
ncbi:hypothetical protein [Hyphomicrobium sp. DY-1]|uniref:hypothetical protein n=1 Tax=Hyphomicrobium sp. DY-1 TaxID=3075650 RepID=UPI0039C4A4F4